MLSCVIRHVDDKSIGLKFRYEEAVQLHKTARSLSAAIANELGGTSGCERVLPYTEPSLLAALAISYSTEMTLHERYVCTGLAGPVADGFGSPELLELQSTAIARLHELSDDILRLSQTIQYVPELYGISSVSPFVIDALYQAGANFAWMVAETGGDKHTEKLATIKTVLGLLGKRWNSANEYLLMIGLSPSQI
ncbi:hypothetical protein SLS56_010775 [Neofusicoccum ribis]|uniref:Uncharacterized protein n=1 Tax=Neofusicoccum ribis TaxID=45134 RepID=A0ABR3SED6_9PEZI